MTTREAQWSQRGATLAVFLGLGIAVGAWAAAIPGLKTALSLSDRDLSFVLLGVSVGSVCATLAAGAIAPRIGTGRSTAMGITALAITTMVPAYAPDLVWLVGAGVLFGLSMGFLDVSMNGHASEVERRWGSPIMSSFHGAFSLGGLVGAGFGGLITTGGFGTAGQLGFPALLVGVLGLGATLGLGAGSRSAAGESGLAWPERAAWGLCVIALFGLMVEGAIADWSAVYLTTVAHTAQGVAAAGFAAFSITMTIGRLTGDHLVRRVGPRAVVIIGGAMAALGLATAVAWPSFLPATLGFGMVGLGLANVVPTIFSAAGRFGRTPAAGMAMVLSLGYAGFISGPPLIGAIASVSDLRVALGFLILISLAVMISGLWFRPAPPAR